MKFNLAIRHLETRFIRHLEAKVLESVMALRLLNNTKTCNVWTPQVLVAQRQQIRRARERKEFYSGFYSWGNGHAAERRQFNRLLQNCIWTIVDDYIVDNLKAPHCNKPRSALMVPASFDTYFGDNIEKHNNKSVKRFAYAQGSGVRSIGLDPEHAKVHHIFPDLSSLRDIIKNVLVRYYGERGERDLFDCDINFVSGKGYWNKKKTNLHTDIEFDKWHRPRSNNSQKPNTPVVIVSFGDPKILQFIRYEGLGSGKPVDGVLDLKFLQTCGKIIILDPRDEQWDEKMRWWKHRSELADQNDGVCITLMFRVVKAEVEVQPEDARVVNTEVVVDLDRKRRFEETRPDFENRVGVFEDYDAEKEAVFQKIRDGLAAYNKSNF